MASAKFVFCLTWLFFGKMAQSASSVCQENRFEFVKTGDTLTLRCSYEGRDAARFHWYKQTLGQKPRLISAFDTNNTYPENHNEFKNDPRFTLDTKDRTYSLTITNLTISDSATYYCATKATRDTLGLTFGNGTIVTVWQEGVNSTSDTTQPKSSVTLNCTVHTGLCDGEHSVYGFNVSEGYYPRIIYSHTGRPDKCERKNNTQTYICVFTLPKKSLNLAHDGIYRCAIASYGFMVFVDGIEEKLNFLVLVYFLSGALAFTTFLVLLLIFLMCLNNKRDCCVCTDLDPEISPPPTANAEQGEQDEEDVHYAALRHHKVKRSRRQRNDVETECVYSNIKQ